MTKPTLRAEPASRDAHPSMNPTTAAGPNSWLHRFGLRFALLYWALYCSDALRFAAPWIGRHVLGLPVALQPLRSSGDSAADWIAAGSCAAGAFAAAAAWASLQRARPWDDWLAAALRIALRLVLADAMLGYGLGKVLPPRQFIPPGAWRLLEPLNEFSPMGLLWTFMGFSPAYTIFGGLAEVFAGILLLFPRTAPLGALATIGVMTNVVMLNFCYDIPVKLYSSHLLAMALWILAPDARRLACVLVLNRPTDAAPPPQWPRAWMRRAAIAVQVLAIAYIAWGEVKTARSKAERSADQRNARVEWQGIWRVERMAREGQAVPPTLSNPECWLWVAVEGNGAVIARTLTDGRLRLGIIKRGATPTRFMIDAGEAQDGPAPIDVRTLAPDQVEWRGQLAGKETHLTLRRVDPAQLMINRGFHWVQEMPVNR